MDPDSALNAIIEAAIDGDSYGLLTLAEGLSEWISRGGYLPKDPRESKDYVKRT